MNYDADATVYFEKTLVPETFFFKKTIVSTVFFFLFLIFFNCTIFLKKIHLEKKYIFYLLMYFLKISAK